MARTEIVTDVVTITLVKSNTLRGAYAKQTYSCTYADNVSALQVSNLIKNELRAFKRVKDFSFSEKMSRLTITYDLTGIDDSAVPGYVAATGNDILRAIARRTGPIPSETPTLVVASTREKPKYVNTSGRRRATIRR